VILPAFLIPGLTAALSKDILFSSSALSPNPYIANKSKKE